MDEAIIDALYRASNAGVPVDLVVRGICGLQARACRGSARTSGCARILGRYLEHSRIFSFHNDGDPQVFIGSADMMHRNLDRRVEALVRITDPDHLAELDARASTSRCATSTSSWHWRSTSDGTTGRQATRSSTAERLAPLDDLQNR